MADTAGQTATDHNRDLARALLRTHLRRDNPDVTVDEFRAAWEEQKQTYKEEARSILRRLDRDGLMIVKKG